MVLTKDGAVFEVVDEEKEVEETSMATIEPLPPAPVSNLSISLDVVEETVDEQKEMKAVDESVPISIASMRSIRKEMEPVDFETYRKLEIEKEELSNRVKVCCLCSVSSWSLRCSAHSIF